jgi:integrase
MGRRDGIYKRGRAWWLEFRHKGIRYQFSLGRNISRSVAAEIAITKRAAVLKGEAGIGRKRRDIAFDDAKNIFLEWVKANRRAKTYRSYSQCLAQLEKSFKGKTLGQIHPFLVEKHKQRRVAENARIAANREITCLKTLYNRLIDWKKYEGENPARRVKKLEESEGKVRFLTYDEESRLLAAAKEPVRTIILVGIYTGLRIFAEVLTLRWENIDLAAGFLTVEAAYAKGKQTDTLPINRMLVEALAQLKASAASEWVFVNREGKPFKSIRTAFENACRNAKLQSVTPHTLRHTFASRLGMQGAGDRTLQVLGRWKEPKMIRRYVHLSEQHLREAVERLAENSPTMFTTLADESPVGVASKVSPIN